MSFIKMQEEKKSSLIFISQEYAVRTKKKSFSPCKLCKFARQPSAKGFYSHIMEHSLFYLLDKNVSSACHFCWAAASVPAAGAGRHVVESKCSSELMQASKAEPGCFIISPAAEHAAALSFPAEPRPVTQRDQVLRVRWEVGWEWEAFDGSALN